MDNNKGNQFYSFFYFIINRVDGKNSLNNVPRNLCELTQN